MGWYLQFLFAALVVTLCVVVAGGVLITMYFGERVKYMTSIVKVLAEALKIRAQKSQDQPE